jgi:hypothetical protein
MQEKTLEGERLMASKSILDQKWLKWLGVDLENDELLIIALMGYAIARSFGYV